MTSTQGPSDPTSPAKREGDPASSTPTITTRMILALALPSLGALIAEPLFTVIDSRWWAIWEPRSWRAWASRRPS